MKTKKPESGSEIDLIQTFENSSLKEFFKLKWSPSERDGFIAYLMLMILKELRNRD